MSVFFGLSYIIFIYHGGHGADLCANELKSKLR